MVIRQCMPRHRHQEWLKFLRTIDREVPKDLQIHLILDNYATHKHEDVAQVAGQSSPVPPAFHPDVLILVEPGGTLVPRADRQSIAARGISFRSRPDRLDPGIPRLPQRRPTTLRVDSDRRIHPRQGRPRTDRPRKSQLNPGHTTSRFRPRRLRRHGGCSARHARAPCAV